MAFASTPMDLEIIILSEVKQKEKEKQINPENVIKKLLNIKEEDENMSNFLTGLKKLTDKPAEFLGGVLRKVDDRLYAVLFGEKDDDKLSPKSFMNQLSNRLGLVFRDFRGFMKDEIYEPLKSLFTGEDSIVHTAKKAIEDTFDVNFSDLNKDVVEFIFVILFQYSSVPAVPNALASPKSVTFSPLYFS